MNGITEDKPSSLAEAKEAAFKAGYFALSDVAYVEARVAISVAIDAYITAAPVVRLVFDAFPGPQGARFIEAEDHNGNSISIGEWKPRPDGLVELVLRVAL
jgi:hypothetical protein